MAVYYTTIKVWGSGPFSIDMLRYDKCYPATEVDSIRIASNLKAKQREEITSDYPIRLVCVHSHRSWMPAIIRWRSFGWTVAMERKLN